MSLEIWLASGKTVIIGGKDFVMMPFPLGRLRSVMDGLQKEVEQTLRESAKKQDAGSFDPFEFIAEVLRRIDAVKVVYNILSEPRDPFSGEKVNPNLDSEFIEIYLDLPTLRKLIVTFVEVNELEETLKNLQSLPGIKALLDSTATIFGVGLLSTLQPSMGSVPSRSDDSPSLKSMPTSEPLMPKPPDLPEGKTEVRPEQ